MRSLRTTVHTCSALVISDQHVHCMQHSVHIESAGPGHSTGFPCPRQYFHWDCVLVGLGFFWSLCAGPIYGIWYTIRPSLFTQGRCSFLVGLSMHGKMLVKSRWWLKAEVAYTRFYCIVKSGQVHTSTDL